MILYKIKTMVHPLYFLTRRKLSPVMAKVVVQSYWSTPRQVSPKPLDCILELTTTWAMPSWSLKKWFKISSSLHSERFRNIMPKMMKMNITRFSKFWKCMIIKYTVGERNRSSYKKILGNHTLISNKRYPKISKGWSKKGSININESYNS